jgi:predicted transcriptional regulator
MSRQSEPEATARELRGSLTVTVPVSVLQRLQPLASRRAKSAFVSRAIAAALDQAEQQATEDREPAEAAS